MDIIIKLLKNKRYVFQNKEGNRIIQAEHGATNITVGFPEEYEAYSKRVDFLTATGNGWTEMLYCPEFKDYPKEYDKSAFTFTLPNDVTVTGELKMQFLAYMPDESLIQVPFEVIPLQIESGITKFKKSGAKNPDLVVLSYNKAESAAFTAQQALNRAEQSDAHSDEAVQLASEARAIAEQAGGTANEAAEKAQNATASASAALLKADSAERTAAAAQVTADASEQKAEESKSVAQRALNNSEAAVSRIGEALDAANGAERTANQASAAADKAVKTAGDAVLQSEKAVAKAEEAMRTADALDAKAASALEKAQAAEDTAASAAETGTVAEATASQAKAQAQNAEEKAERAAATANAIDAKAQSAIEAAQTAGTAADYAVIQVSEAVAAVEALDESLQTSLTEINAAVQAVVASAETADAKAEEAKTDTQSALNGLNAKVDKTDGKQLSTEDYSASEKTKLAGIEDGANKYVHPVTHPPDVILQDADNRFVTDAQIDKLACIEENANNYVHPTAHPAAIIIQDESNRFIMDTERAAWNAHKEPHTASVIIAPWDAGAKSRAGADVVLAGDESDSTKLNEAIAALNGGEVKILEGTVKCFASIALSDNVTISGQGGGTVFQKNTAGVLFAIEEKENCTLKDFKIDGNSTTGYAISCKGGNCTFENLTVFGAQTGIELDSCTNIFIRACRLNTQSYSINVSQSTMVTIEGTSCTSAGTAFCTANNQSTNCLLSNTAFFGTGNNVMLLRRLQYSRIVNCHIESTGGTMLLAMQFCAYNVVANNVIKAEGSKFTLSSGNYNLVTGNLVNVEIKSTESETQVINNLNIAAAV